MTDAREKTPTLADDMLGLLGLAGFAADPAPNQQIASLFPHARDALLRIHSHLTLLLAENEALRGALKPFADYLDAAVIEPDDHMLATVTVSDLRRARAALAPARSGEGE